MQKTVIDELTKAAADKGKIIELGWLSLRSAALPTTAPDIQVTEMRKAFFAGAQHLFASVMSILEPGNEPTEKDLDRMSLIVDELKDFYKELKESVYEQR